MGNDALFKQELLVLPLAYGPVSFLSLEAPKCSLSYGPQPLLGREEGGGEGSYADKY